ncbi:MAG: DUF1648 domain-containing protein [Acidobacteriaceae bacterium]|nr:DUF1648 domain-containing protein [Acidobacteriaceae bacterium]
MAARLMASLAPIFLFGLVFLLMPRVRAGILFGRSVPVEFAKSPGGQAIVGRYQTQVLAVILAVMLICGAALLNGLYVLSVAIAIAEFPLLMWAWIAAWRRTEPFAVKVPLRRSASLAPRALWDGFSLSQLLALLPLAIAALYLQLHWLQIPVRFATHWDASGLPNAWTARSLAGVFGPLIVGALIISGVAALSLITGHIRPDQARQMRPILAVVTWMMAALVTAVALHPLSKNPDGGPGFVWWIILPGMVGLVVSISYALHMPQRDGAYPWDGTPDSGWRWGLLYYNPQDASVIVRNRFGLGWALNFGHPYAKLWLGSTLLFTAIVLFVVLASVHAQP